MMLVDILTDGIFAAVAAIGFGAISDPPLRAFPSIALLIWEWILLLRPYVLLSVSVWEVWFWENASIAP